MASSPHHTPLPSEHRCDQDARLDSMEERIHDHGVALTQHAVALTDGKIEFASIKKDLAQIIQNQMELKASIADRSPIMGKVIDALIFWAVPICGGGLLWVIKMSGQIPTGVHP
jgi:hypothetical protein